MRALPPARRVGDRALSGAPVGLPPRRARCGHVLPGWQSPLDDVGHLEQLPPAARDYVEFVSRELDVPIELVGVGAERERVLV